MVAPIKKQRVDINAEVVEGVLEGFLKRGFDNAAPTPQCHREWWALVTAPDKYVAIAAPRGHAKSTALTHAYTITSIIFRQSSFVLIVSDTESQAVFFLNDIKKELSENEDLMKTFGISKLVKDAESDFIVEFQDGHQARVMAKGSGQSLRGVKWDGKRPDLIVGDDLENDEIVMNKERRNKFRRWFSGTLIRCLSKYGMVRLVGTVLHTDSQLERLMPQAHRKDVIEEPLKVYYARNSKSVWKAVKYRAHDKKLTVALWPEYLDVQWLRAERQIYADQGMLDVWAQEMLNEPLDEEHAPFTRSMFKGAEIGHLSGPMNYYVASDLALSLEQTRDYCVFVVGGVNPEGKLIIPHVIHARMQSDEIEETIFQLNDAYKPELFLFEKGQIFLGLQPHMVNGMMKRGKYFNYEALPSITDKLTRSSAIRARMKAGAVLFDKNADWFPDFEDELLKFPRGGHDDQVDGISLLGRGLVQFVEAPTPEEQADEAYEDEKRETGFYLDGRNAVTGY